MFFGEPFGGVIPGVRGAVMAVLLRTDAPLTGRQIHSLLRTQHSLWSVQQAIKDLGVLGLLESQTVGRAGIHVVNEGHAAVGPLRALLDPVGMLKAVAAEVVSDRVSAVILFGSVARGEATMSSDIDLAVIADQGWDGGQRLQDLVGTRLGNHCDVLAFTPGDFAEAARRGEPVVVDILHYGVVLVGVKPAIVDGV